MPPTAFEAFIQTCTPLLKIPALEESFRAQVKSAVDKIMRFETADGAAPNVKRFLREDEDFLGIMLSMSNLSQEKFLRVLTAERFTAGDFAPEWSIAKINKKIREDDGFADKIARLFLEGNKNKLLAEKMADFYLDQLSLSGDWANEIGNSGYIGRIVRAKLSGKYAVQKGAHIERMIGAVIDKTGATWKKGQVELVGKEVDHAVPSLEDARVLVMSSYQETTSSGQTARANEQRAMYLKIQNENQRYPNRPPRVMVNVVDGGGWLARRADLQKMHGSCDYCLNINTLPQLADIVREHVLKA